jgi:hypothetical protein
MKTVLLTLAIVCAACGGPTPCDDNTDATSCADAKGCHGEINEGMFACYEATQPLTYGGPDCDTLDEGACASRGDCVSGYGITPGTDGVPMFAGCSDAYN